MIHLHTKFHTLRYNYSLVIAIQSKDKYGLDAASMFIYMQVRRATSKMHNGNIYLSFGFMAMTNKILELSR
jgi:hypothetical protein